MLCVQPPTDDLHRWANRAHVVDSSAAAAVVVARRRLHYWVFGGPWTYGEAHQERPGATGVDREVLDEVMSAGAAVVGRRMYDVTGGWGGRSPFGAPCVVVTHRVGDRPEPASGFEFVDGIEAALNRARRQIARVLDKA